MTRRTLLIAIIFASQIAIGCRYNRPLIARGAGCWPTCHTGPMAPMAGPAMADPGYGGGCSTCGTATAGYPVAGMPGPGYGPGPVAGYPTGYPTYSSSQSSMIPPPQIVKSGDAPMPMPIVGAK